MQLKKVAVLVAAFSTQALWAQESAYRAPEKDFTLYEKKFFGSGVIYPSSRGSGGSAHSQAELYNEAELPKATSWKASALHRRFVKMRDFQVIDGEGNPTWKYPDDGCYSRAAVANRTAFHHFYPVPKKVFAFGNLSVETPNTPSGRVSWWYHMAPIVEVGGKKYVIDPALEFSRPLLLKEWLATMGDPEKMKVSICESGTYFPSDGCNKRTDGLELKALRSQRYFLRLEEDRIQRLGLTE